MTDYQAYLAQNPLAERDAALLRDALTVLAQLRASGRDRTTYELAPTFGSASTRTTRPIMIGYELLQR